MIYELLLNNDIYLKSSGLLGGCRDGPAVKGMCSLTEDSRSVPSTHMVAGDQVPEDPVSPSGLRGHYTHIGSYTQRGTY